MAVQVPDDEESGIGDENFAVVDHRKGLSLEERLNNPILFTRGLPSSDFYLILQGHVTVCSGNEGFMVQQSAFNYLGE